MINYKFWSDYKHSISDIKSINFLLTLLSSTPVTITAKKLDELSPNSKLLLAINSDNKIVGMATLAIIIIPTGKSGRLEDVVVDNNFRGQGIGTALIEKIIIESKKLHLKKLDLISKPQRIEANKLYLKLNFSKIETNVYRMKF